jgi:hypothetical protein
MAKSTQHKTKWTVNHLTTNGKVYFNSASAAREYALTYGGNIVIRPPIYAHDDLDLNEGDL